MAGLLIYGGKVVTARNTMDASILIDSGKIVTVCRSRNLKADVRVNAKGLYLLPGLIDTHVHFRDPGMTHKEDFLTGTRGAAKGGVTTVVDMPVTLPTVISRQSFLEKARLVKEKAVVDFGLYGGLGASNLPEVRGLAEAGALAFKTYMVSPPSERMHEYEGTFVTDAASLYRVMEAAKSVDTVLCLHAESDSMIQHLTKTLQCQGRRDALAHAEARPGFTEVQAVSEALIMSEALRARIHFLHMSTSGAVDLLRYWKRRGLATTAETCPHYLLLTQDALREHGPHAKFNPPPRSKADCDALWKGISDRTIDMIVSDHAPHSLAEKEAGRDDIWKAPPGTPGVETRLPLLLSQVAKGRIDLNDLVRLCATQPAKIFGLYPRKGEIAPGADADIILLDPKMEWTLESEELETKAKGTFLFDGWKIKGKPVATYLRGDLVTQGNVVVGKPGNGELITRGVVNGASRTV